MAPGWQGLEGDFSSSLGVTRREAEVLDAVVGRLSNAEIATKLFISERTVESHVSSLLRKFSAHDRGGLIDRARALAGDDAGADATSRSRSMLRGARNVEGGVPLPGRLRVRPSTDVVGRRIELGAIAAAVARVTGGGGAEVVVVCGEAGVGKSTVLAQAARDAYDGGACVLFGHGEAELTAPYQLFVESISHLVEHAPPRTLTDHVAACGTELVRLVPTQRTRLTGSIATPAADPETVRFQMFASAVHILDSWTREQPIVLVLDDLQWADPSSLLLLRHVVAAAPSRLLVVGACRDPGLPGPPAIVDALADLHRQPGVTRIELGGLDRTAIRSLVEAAGHSLDEAGLRLADALHDETDGNAFFVNEVLRNMAGTPPGAELAVPSSVRVVIESRVARLGPQAAQTLGFAAVIGRDFDFELLAAASELDDDALAEVIDAATRAALMRELPDAANTYTFAHALIQHTVYAGIGPARRAQAHRRVAEALERFARDETAIDAWQLARHWEQAGPDRFARARHYAKRAGDAALADLAPGDALAYFSHALSLHTRSRSREPSPSIDILTGIGIAQRQLAEPDSRDTLLDASRKAASIGDADRLAAAVLANNRGTTSHLGSADDDRIEMLELAADVLPADHPSRPVVLSTLCSELAVLGSIERRQAVAAEAVELADATGNDATVIRVLNDIAFPLATPQLIEQSLQWTARALRLAEQLGVSDLLFWAAHHSRSTALRVGDLALAERCVEIQAEIADRLNQPTLRWVVSFARAHIAQTLGDNDDAAAAAREALRIGTASGQPDAALIFNLQITAIHNQRGSIADLHAELADLDSLAPQAPWIFPAIHALELAQLGRLDDARHLLTDFTASGCALPLSPGAWLTIMTLYAQVAVACQDRQSASVLIDQLTPLTDQLGSTGCGTFSPISYFIGQLATVVGRFDLAETSFVKADTLNRRAGAKCYRALNDLAWGLMLLDRHAPEDVGHAQRRLRSAHAVAHANGYAQIVRHTADALAMLS